MASTYTPLGIELQATGENAGTWGTKTNTNLQIIEQIAGGFTQQAVTSVGTVNLSVSDVSTGATLAHRMNEFTGSIPKKIITVGVVSKNPQWRKIRERIINIPIISCKKTTSFGTAILAINAK